MMSVTPPAGAGDTMVMVLLGKVCAAAGTATPSVPSTSHTTCPLFMPVSSWAELPTFRHGALDSRWRGSLRLVDHEPLKLFEISGSFRQNLRGHSGAPPFSAFTRVCDALWRRARN